MAIFKMGNVLRTEREKKGWTQENLAARAGVNSKTISRAELGEGVSTRVATMIAKALDIETERLFAFPKADGMQKSSPISIAMFSSGRLSPRFNRLDAFRANLDSLLLDSPYRAEYEFIPAPFPANKIRPSNFEWHRTLNSHYSKFAAANYLVTFGTPASVALRHFLDVEYGRQPTIFLAVTEPAAAGLVAADRSSRWALDGISELTVDGFSSNYASRSHTPQVAGVAMPKASAVLTLLQEMFPHKSLIFVYSNQFQSDVLFAREIHKLNQSSCNPIPIICSRVLPTKQDFSDKNSVYFSWYTFAYMYRASVIPEYLRNRIVVSTSFADVKSPNLATASVGADDGEIGRLGALLVSEHQLKKICHLGNVEILIPKCKYGLNCSTAAGLDHRFSNAVVQGAAWTSGNCSANA